MTPEEVMSRCYEHGQPDYVLAGDTIKALLAATPAVGGEREAPTVEGRLADIIEMDNVEIRIDEYRLSQSDRAKLVATLRAAQPASPLRGEAMKRIKAVCEDNAPASCNHKMALDFVLQIATAALFAPPEQPAADSEDEPGYGGRYGLQRRPNKENK